MFGYEKLDVLLENPVSVVLIGNNIFEFGKQKKSLDAKSTKGFNKNIKI
jgi:hypothetical protein